jgi:HSP20 family protein
MTYVTPQNTWFAPALNFDVTGGAFPAMRNAIDHLFDEAAGFSSPMGARRGSPRINISETDNSVEIEAELPGVEQKDVEVALNDDVLTIKGEKRMEREDHQRNYCHQERVFGKFSRSITLSFEPDPKTVKALFVKGVLKVTLPKSPSVIQHTVKIQVTAA